MIKIKIGKKKYNGIHQWENMSLSVFCELASIPIPSDYEAFILADGRFNPEDKKSFENYINIVSQMPEESFNVLFPDYYKKVIMCLTDIPENKLKLLTTEQVIHLYDLYFRPFVVSLIYHSPLVYSMGELLDYEPTYQKYIRIGLYRYYLPEVVNILGVDVPLEKEPVITFTEVADMFRGMRMSREDVHRLALFMAIYCRRRGEQYDERKVLQREKLFMKAPMSAVWTVFFYTCQRIGSSENIIRLFGKLLKPIHEIAREVKTFCAMEAGELSLS